MLSKTWVSTSFWQGIHDKYVTTTEGEDSSSNTYVSNTNNASSIITQDQYETLMNLLQTSSINQGNIPAVSNHVGSSTTHLPLHNEGNSQTFASK